MDRLPIMRFEPLYKEVVWGGRRMGPLLGRQLPRDAPIGESWEIVDLPEDQSKIASGFLAGQTLGKLRDERCDELMGGAALLDERFPVLLKFIDAARTLSVQVHPDERACARLGHGARPKTEAWFIIDCEPGAELFVGLRPRVDRQALAEAVSQGTVDRLLHRLTVAPGDFVYLPAGTIHAIGEGIVLAEVQQSSDTTYRVFDWNRTGLNGKPRRLHVDEALVSTDFGQIGPPDIQRPASGRQGVVCPWFEMELLRAVGSGIEINGMGPLALMGVGGAGELVVRACGQHETIRLGETLLVPAWASGAVHLSGSDELAVLSVRICAPSSER